MYTGPRLFFSLQNQPQVTFPMRQPATAPGGAWRLANPFPFTEEAPPVVGAPDHSLDTLLWRGRCMVQWMERATTEEWRDSWECLQARCQFFRDHGR